MQGKEMTVCILYKKVRDFKDKFRLLKHQIQQKNYFHFHHLTELLTNKEIQEDQIPTSLILEVFEDILNDFSDRFQDFEKISPTLSLVAFPHLVETETAPLHVLIELKNDEQLLNKFRRQKDLLEIWKDAFQYLNMQPLARETLVLFSSTYVCEAAFSAMKYLKNSYRTRLLDKNLEAELRLIISREIPNFQSLSSAIQNQSSH